MAECGDAWQAAMRRGDLAAAWTISDAVLAARNPAEADDPTRPYHLRWIWTGEPLDGRDVLVRCYHGLGDTLNFIRLLAPLRARVASIALEVQPELLPLLGALPGPDRLIAFRPDAPTPRPPGAVAIELMELAHAVRLTRQDLPGPIPYLHASAVPRAAGLRLGLCWSAGAWNPDRSVPLAALTAALPKATLVSLQRGPAAGEATADFINPKDRSTDIQQTAALIASCDLIITVDTMVAHLAGALARPTLLLLKHDPDWRWMSDCDSQPWYPTITRLRQQSTGNWEGPLSEVKARALPLTRWGRAPPDPHP